MKQTIATLIVSAALIGCTSETTMTEPQLLSITSTQSFDNTENNLRDGLTKRSLKLFTVVDHGAGAQSVGEDIGQSKLFIFGNPKAGTPLMVAESRLGLELPMKILLVESDGMVQLHRTDIAATIRNFGVTDQNARLAKIDETLTTIMTEAAGN